MGKSPHNELILVPLMEWVLIQVLLTLRARMDKKSNGMKGWKDFLSQN